jgi:hypothetical protein
MLLIKFLHLSKRKKKLANCVLIYTFILLRSRHIYFNAWLVINIVIHVLGIESLSILYKPRGQHINLLCILVLGIPKCFFPHTFQRNGYASTLAREVHEIDWTILSLELKKKIYGFYILGQIKLCILIKYIYILKNNINNILKFYLTT